MPNNPQGSQRKINHFIWGGHFKTHPVFFLVLLHPVGVICPPPQKWPAWLESIVGKGAWQKDSCVCSHTSGWLLKRTVDDTTHFCGCPSLGRAHTCMLSRVVTCLWREESCSSQAAWFYHPLPLRAQKDATRGWICCKQKAAAWLRFAQLVLDPCSLGNGAKSRGPQVLVHVSLYQGNPFGVPTMTHSHFEGSWTCLLGVA